MNPVTEINMNRIQFYYLFVVFLSTQSLAGQAKQLDLTLEGNWDRGTFRDSVVNGDHLYLAADKGLKIFSLSTDGSPQLVNEYTTPDNVMDVVVSGNYAYLVNYNNGLRILDISNPNAPVQVSHLDISAYSRGLAVAGTYAYILTHSKGLQVIDISQVDMPVRIADVDIEDPVDVAVSGDYAYVAAGDGLYIIDISKPSTPEIVSHFAGSPDDKLSLQSIIVVGNYVYVADKPTGYSFYHPIGFYPTYYHDPGGLYIIDVSNPVKPILHNKWAAWGNIRITQANGRVYTSSAKTLYILDAENTQTSTSPNLGAVESLSEREKYIYDIENVYDIGEYVFSITANQNYVYIVKENGQLDTIAIDELGSPKKFGSLKMPQPIKNIVALEVQGNYAYLASQFAGLHILDISHSSKPMRVAWLELANEVKAMSVVNDYAYVLDDLALRIIDLQDPTAPILTSAHLELPNASDVSAFTVEDGYAYLVNNRTGLQIINVQDPTSPLLVSELELDNTNKDIFDIVVANGYAYLADNKFKAGTPLLYSRQGILHIVDVRTPTTPVMVSSFNFPHAILDLTVVGQYAYVVHFPPSLSIIDASLPDAPTLISTLPLSLRDHEFARAIAVNNHYAYISTSHEQSHIIDVSIPSMPTPKLVLDKLSFGNTFVVTDKYIYAGGRPFIVLAVVEKDACSATVINNCQAHYIVRDSLGEVCIPCLAVSDATNTPQIFSVKMQQKDFPNLRFEFNPATLQSHDFSDPCTANYSLDTGFLHLPCISVGTNSYEVDMQRNPNELTLEVLEVR